ncbi:hybrid sensor histidine kinase/response regulator [Halosimplex pelagicum]|uniref:histidine kinase n=1 Tax=Halosimplex pelagicum TaxID=869886 RepID=A0A7D5TDF0_9EURY|nr:hybrid sensor histidine kinase/response regulator [Halosimplex pelagicum]QLH83873.1 hybrid sensor histidine kinase/response regulator [Halosimplex pelagicum]
MKQTVHALLVEDNPGDAKLVEHYLDNPSVQAFLDEVTLTHVETLPAAEAALTESHYDVLLLDLGLEQSEGLETLCLASEFDSDVPIIVLTGLENTDIAVEAIQSGAQDYLPKGELDGDRLVRALRYAIDRHEQEQTLTRRNEQLDFFNSVLRHDMMNGFNVIMARADMLRTDLDDPEHVAHAENIHDWSVKITDLSEKVRSILDSVADDGDAALEPVALDPLVTAEAERVDAMADRVDVDVDVPEGTTVLANDLFEDVVANLLTNAVEHSDTTTSVRVSVDDGGPTVSLRVADDGPGVPPGDQADIFERGGKGDASTGTGFGLFFVSSMVESYGGSVRAEESDRGGAAFVLELPRA